VQVLGQALRVRAAVRVTVTVALADDGFAVVRLADDVLLAVHFAVDLAGDVAAHDFSSCSRGAAQSGVVAHDSRVSSHLACCFLPAWPGIS
jgi:hypothetical protein